MLKKSTYIFLSILLCVPLLFIIYFSFSIDAAKPTDDTLRSLSVKTADGRTFDINDAEDLRLYLAAYGNAKKINESELLHDLSLETPATVTHSDTDSVYNYDYYMSTDPAACYYYDASDVLYRFDEADAAALSINRSVEKILRLKYENIVDNYDEYLPVSYLNSKEHQEIISKIQ